MLSILLVEDDELIRRSVEQALAAHGLDVVPVADGHAVLGRLAGPRPSVLVTDINLGPGPDGLEISRLARATWPDISVVYMSAHDLAECGVEGALLVAKPFDPDRLARLVCARHADACADAKARPRLAGRLDPARSRSATCPQGVLSRSRR